MSLIHGNEIFLAGYAFAYYCLFVLKLISMATPSPNLRAQVASQIEAIRLLIARLSDSIPGSAGSAGFVKKAQNELELLLGVLSNIRSKSVLCDDQASPKLWSKLEDCHCCLLDLQNLQKSTEQCSSETHFLEIRAQLSDLIFELSVINADIAMYVGLHIINDQTSSALIRFSDLFMPTLSAYYRLMLVSLSRASEIYNLFMALSMTLQTPKQTTNGKLYKASYKISVSHLSSPPRNVNLSSQLFEKQ